MSVLLCRFASPRSAPDRIRRWITYLEEKRAVHADDVDDLQLIEGLLSTAREWANEERMVNAGS